MKTYSVLLNLGSNIPPAFTRIRDAAQLIAFTALYNCVASAAYHTPPWGYEHQDPFINIAITGISTMSPPELHKHLKEIEIRQGRIDRGLWQAREIDIDIILMDSEIIETPALSIPHPRFRNRRFVLQPSADIAAGWRDPVSGHTIAELLAACTDPAVITRETTPVLLEQRSLP
ncbi:MAG: 2-amino-4-hydroxy-6-hydroxymethyldihydropteridine diphosphokinase [Chlorobi bacterium]|nr:MAG: 2-amino-4-hydroxy-6-hydroxymethyldihydropteridine diphosphokinase [Bacteroidota bacterium]KXK34452.1 MAG: 7, 8-Dihydro-6-hydroxymethylpterin-pyrophosphokinase [Chlorobi bacterium OLB6]MBE2266212.1 2-amino-4-hydroxy-6-hydroxymethyldihydropteridine diphosphokinase [Flavobacteriales bacterium]MBL1161128.1 2-amino-4-hydroxy-6-hydroxymethyldihydropteridine diphosphokinase [Chlorobiota bacterium]MBW7854507.1 2-amino-4-hydroxy-6-hydroxymethyldihydropteridine diphosphokinase [Candidatus Kapabac